ncbi:GNAT family N-acetyltransferase [Arenimonas donghaensis]|uniref:GNAT family N-acetyltransferase n=1 Tax=Arenimonas donghaensis TaxID=375061 RepID=UPI0013628036|nr:GNAT family N-acetyltransferase [Arenimonas donghaensis]
MPELPTLAGDPLLLRPIGDQDQPLYVALYGDGETMGRAMPALDTTEAMRAFARERQAPRSGMRRMTWILADKHAGAGFGLLGLVLDEARGAEVGVLLPPAHQGQGHATQAIALVARYAFETLDLHRLYTRHAEGHAAASGLMRRLGFKPAPAGAPPHPIRWTLTRETWQAARRDKAGPFS